MAVQILRACAAVGSCVQLCTAALGRPSSPELPLSHCFSPIFPGSSADRFFRIFIFFSLILMHTYLKIKTLQVFLGEHNKKSKLSHNPISKPHFMQKYHLLTV